MRRITLRGRTESEDQARRFSERYYGRFERRIPLQDIGHSFSRVQEWRANDYGAEIRRSEE
jgi:hypothetical protein